MSQNQAILNVLKRRRKRWVPLPELAHEARCFAVSTRISNLRSQGYRIVNKMERVDGVNLSFYRLEGRA